MRKDPVLTRAGLLALFLAVVITTLRVPFVALVPGPVTDTLGKGADGVALITVDGRRTYPTDGKLFLTTVGVRGGPPSPLSVGLAVRWWFDGHKAVLPQDVVYPPDQTVKQVEKQNTADMEQSQQHAITAALRNLHVPVSVEVTVGGVEKGRPAFGKLSSGDVVTAVNGTSVASADQLRSLLAAGPAGSTVRLDVRRGGSTQAVALATTAGPNGRPIVGIEVREAPHYPFTITINLKDVGGPSAGLMFALGIIDKLTPGPINGGKVLAGTGTMSDDGTVGPIGGIQQKIVAARQAGAHFFLTPKDNCASAAAVRPAGLTLVRVGTLAEALDRLAAIRAGRAVATC